MTDTSFDEARRCPRCDEPGRGIRDFPGPGGSRFHSIMCLNQRCRWHNTTYLIQVNPDGTIPPPTTDRDKNFPALPARDQELIDRQMDGILNQQLSSGGGEVRGGF